MMKRRILLFMIILLFCEHLFCLSQINDYNYSFRSMCVEQGLSQNMVYSILQDKTGFLWFGTQDGLNRFDGLNFKIFKSSTTNPYSIGSNSIFCLMENTDGCIWVGTKNGIYIYNPINERFSLLIDSFDGINNVAGIIRDIKKDTDGNIWFCSEHEGLYRYSVNKKLTFYPLPGLSIRKIATDDLNNIWLATHGLGILKFNPRTKQINNYKICNKQKHKGENDINDLCFISSSQLLVGTSNKGVLSFNVSTGIFEKFIDADKFNSSLYVRCIYKTKNQSIWIGTESGVFIYDFQSKKTTHIYHSTSDIYSLTDNAVHSIMQDREGNMWVGTFFGGVNYYSPYFSTFKKYYPIPDKNSIKGKSIGEFCEDDKRNIWIATEDAGLNMYNPQTNSFTADFLPSKNIHSLLFDNGKLWVGAFLDGLYVFDTRTNKIISHYKSSFHPHSLMDNNVYSIYKDSSGKIWIGTMTGLHFYSKDTKSFVRIKEDVVRSQVNDIMEDYCGILWFATIGNGLFSYNALTNEWNHFQSPLTKSGYESKSILCLLQDSKNRLWLGSEGLGVCVYQRENNTFSEPITTKEGLPNDVIYKLIDDGRDIWGSTNKGIFRLNPETKDISTYTHVHGLLGDQFNYKSGIRTEDGQIYFGGVKGFISFSPSKLIHNEISPFTVIKELKVGNSSVEIGENSLLQKSIVCLEELRIPSKYSNFSLEFASLSFVSPMANNFSYKLVGYDDNWSKPSTNNQVNYLDLPVGKYTFQLKSSNSDGVWNQEGTSLRIYILPPWYKTIWAYIVYAVGISLLIVYIIKRFLQKTQKRHEYLLQEFEKNKEIELYNSKINFFTNITHEIRTPLSLIKLPLEEVINNTDKTSQNWEDLIIIKKNTSHLYDLVTELLDFRRIESKGLKLNLIKVDIVTLMTDVVENYNSSARLKNIQIKKNFSTSTFLIDIDPSIFNKILNNIFSNALKYAVSVIEVLFIHTDTHIKISISNDGTKIPQKFIEKIFDPFFKINPNVKGAGIGLSYVKMLVELHKGEVFCDISKDGVTAFVIEIPIHIDQSRSSIAVLETDKDEYKVSDQVDESVNLQSSLLLVEDNVEFLNFLSKQLRPMFNILQAQDGQSAIDIIEKENVELVISDIMMPVMDGYTMCDILKNNVKTSHIPIILLTAKTDLQSKLDGFNCGADEYIVKPYTKEYLIARIYNLMDNRRKIRETYKNSPELAYKTLTYSKLDEEFMANLVKIIHKYMEDTNLNVDIIAEEMNLSRATLYRKINSISELTPNEFILLTRLKKGAELLKTKNYRINEIAYMVGFNSPNYFSKCFFKQFGVLPKNFSES